MNSRNAGERDQDQHPEFGLEATTLRMVLEHAPSPIVVVDAQGTIVLTNRALEELVGYGVAELQGQSVEVLLPAGLRSLHERHRTDFLKEPERRPMGKHRDLPLRTSEGSVLPVEIGLSPVRGPSGLLVVCSLTDLSARSKLKEDLLRTAANLKKANQELAETAATDSLTSLRNRGAFMDHLQAQLEASVRHGRPLSLLILDLDHFKDYNDEFGHLAGDEVLRRLGRVLRGAARRSDLVARLGGEEFGVILPETDGEGAVASGHRFREAVESAQWPRREVTVSIGATTVNLDPSLARVEPSEISRVLTDADRALYRSKDRGRNRVTHSFELRMTPG